jgi:hypothetical protein
MAVSLVESNAPSPTTAINESSIRLTKPNSTNSVRQSLKKPIPNALALKGIIKNGRNIMFYFYKSVFNAGTRTAKRGVSGQYCAQAKEKMTIFLNHISTHITKNF